MHLRNLFLILKRPFLSKDFDLSTRSFLSNKGSALVSVIVASAIGAIVILGVGTSIVNQSTSQKKIQDSNKNLWKVIQLQSVLERFASQDNSKNTIDNERCLKVLDKKIKNKPDGFNFVARDCHPNNDPELAECAVTTPPTPEDKPKIIHLTDSAGKPPPDDEWKLKIPVLSSQCCSLFYEEIITLAYLNRASILELATRTLIETANTTPTKTNLTDAVDAIIGNPTPLTYATTICGNAIASGAGGVDNPECYEVNPDGLTQVGCEDSPSDDNKTKLTSFGFNAGNSSNTGNYNTFIGNQAGYSNTTANHNTFIGNQAGYSNTGESNTFIGNSAGQANTTGTSNTFLGYAAGEKNEDGNYNTFMGNWAGYSNTMGASNTFLGMGVGRTNTTGSYNTFIGKYAGHINTTGKYNAFMGNEAGYKNETGDDNTFIGYHAGRFNTTGTDNIFIGSGAGYKNETGEKNTFIGYHAGRFNTDGDKNTFLGFHAGHFNTTGISNTFLGFYAGNFNTGGSNNTFIGYNAGQANTTGTSNTFIGSWIGEHNTTGERNTFVGHEAGRHIDGENNTFIGYAAGRSYRKPSNNNISIGHYSGCSSGIDNHLCGSQSDNNIFIGARYIPPSGVDKINNFLNIGNVIIGKTNNSTNLPKTEYPSSGIKIRGNLEVTEDLTAKNLSVTGEGLPTAQSNLTNCRRVGTDLTGKFLCKVHESPSSDSRLKKQIKDLDGQLSNLLILKPKAYYWKDKTKGRKKQFGLIAQDIKPVFPNLVHEDKSKKKLLSLNYNGFIPIIIQSLKEFYHSTTKAIASLKESVASLKGSLTKEIAKLTDKDKKLERELASVKKSLKKEIELLKKEIKSLKEK